ITYIHQSCYDDFGIYKVLSYYGSNIYVAIDELASKASTTYYDTYTTGTGDSNVNAFFSCRYDISPHVCQSCVAATATNTNQCFMKVESLISYEECTLHYSNRTIFSVIEDLPRLYHFSNSTADRRPYHFTRFLANHVNELITDVTSSSRRFATTSPDTQTVIPFIV
ncbi:Cysteine-rich repeat secretory protein 1, partial [Bienertia sinuspersici]